MMRSHPHHGTPDKSAGNFGHSLFIYDENVRVPLIVAAPGLIQGRTVTTRVASVVDVTPTVLDLLGVAGSPADGRSLLAGPPQMALFSTDYSTGLLGLQDGCSKFIFDMDAPRDRLFDTCVDPDERQDRVSTSPELVRLYRDRLLAWSSATRDAIAAGR